MKEKETTDNIKALKGIRSASRKNQYFLRSNRLDAGHGVVQDDPQELRPTSGGPHCHNILDSSLQIIQLEAGPRSRGN